MEHPVYLVLRHSYVIFYQIFFYSIYSLLFSTKKNPTSETEKLSVAAEGEKKRLTEKNGDDVSFSR